MATGCGGGNGVCAGAAMRPSHGVCGHSVAAAPLAETCTAPVWVPGGRTPTRRFGPPVSHGNGDGEEDSTGRGTASRGGSLRHDALAGLINAVVSIPDGLASAALAGVNPVYGLYTSVGAPIGGSLLVSAQLM